MTTKQLDRMLETAVADALGVELPRRNRRSRKSVTVRPASATRSTRREQVLEHA